MPELIIPEKFKRSKWCRPESQPDRATLWCDSTCWRRRISAVSQDIQPGKRASGGIERNMGQSPDIATYWWRRNEETSLLQNIDAVVRNLSDKANAINTAVHCFTSTFGLGMPRSLLGTQITNVAAHSKRKLTLQQTQIATDGDNRVPNEGILFAF